MARYIYSFNKYDNNKMARAHGRNLRISLKKSIETLREIRGKKVNEAIKILEGVIRQEKVIPYRRYFSEMAHKKGKGIDVGGYPVNVAKEVLKLLLNAKKNAEDKGLGEDLYVLSASARKGERRYHNGRYLGRKMKSTHVEIIIGVKEEK